MQFGDDSNVLETINVGSGHMFMWWGAHVMVLTSINGVATPMQTFHEH